MTHCNCNCNCYICLSPEAVEVRITKYVRGPKCLYSTAFHFDTPDAPGEFRLRRGCIIVQQALSDLAAKLMV